jgi:hypothetical protein
MAGAGPAGADSLKRQTQAEADRKSAGCLSCHVGIEPMHESKRVKLGCSDCHGGNSGVSAGGAAPGSDDYVAARNEAHVQPEYPERWANAEGQPSSANPVRSYTLLNDESPEFIQFFNPGDLRVADQTCGVDGCHPKEVLKVRKSIMTTSAMLWGGAAYNNGIVSVKNYILGE